MRLINIFISLLHSIITKLSLKEKKNASIKGFFEQLRRILLLLILLLSQAFISYISVSNEQLIV